MKSILIILGLGVAAGLWQWQSLAKLKDKEAALREELVLLKSQPTESDRVSAAQKLSAKIEADSKKPTFEVASFIEVVRDIAANKKAGKGRPDQKQVLQLMEQLSLATTAQLKELVSEIAKSDLPSEAKQEFPLMVAMMLLPRDPTAAAELALESDPRAFGNVMQMWTQKDPAAASEWLAKAQADGRVSKDTHPNLPDLRSTAVVGDLAKDPAGSKEALAGMDDGQRQVTIRMAMSKMSEAHRVAFLQEMAASPKKGDLESAAAALAEDGDFATTRATLEKAKLSDEKFAAAAEHIAQANVGSSTPERVRWFLQNAKGPDRELGLRRILVRWTEQDYNGAAAWLKDQPQSTDRDVAVSAFAGMVAIKEPTSAADWAATIRDEKIRQEAVQAVWQRWHSQAPEEAASYFAGKGWKAPTQ